MEEKVIARSLHIDSKGNEEETVVTSGYMHVQGTEIPETTQTASETPQEFTRRTIKDYLADENVQKNLRLWAEHFNTRFHANWFSIAQVIKKTPMKDVTQAGQILDLIILSGLGHREDRNGIMKYKMTLQIEHKIKLLEQQQETYREQIALLDKEIASLRAQEVATVVI